MHKQNILWENTKFQTQEEIYDEIKHRDSENMYLSRENLRQGPAFFRDLILTVPQIHLFCRYS